MTLTGFRQLSELNSGEAIERTEYQPPTDDAVSLLPLHVSVFICHNTLESLYPLLNVTSWSSFQINFPAFLKDDEGFR